MHEISLHDSIVYIGMLRVGTLSSVWDNVRKHVFMSKKYSNC
jgi:hypothetical protein